MSESVLSRQEDTARGPLILIATTATAARKLEHDPDIARRSCPGDVPYAGAVATASQVRGLVVVVEDEPAIAEVIRLNLAAAGFGVHLVGDGPAALADISRLRPAAVLLDVGLPGIDGTEVFRTLRQRGDWTPVLFVTARDDEVDRILALEAGADDYITKPFSPRELVARLSAVLRRTSGAVVQAPLVSGRVRLDAAGRRVHVDEVPVQLTATEFDLLRFLMSRPGQVFSREQLISQVWGYSAEAGARTVDVHVAQVRAKLGNASPIRTVRGVGYGAETR